MSEANFIHEEYIILLEIIAVEEERLGSKMSQEEIDLFLLTYVAEHHKEIAKEATSHLGTP